MHLALGPGTAIHDSIGVVIDTLALHKVGGPATLVDIAIGVSELSVLRGLVARPGAGVGGTIYPLNCAFTMAHVA